MILDPNKTYLEWQGATFPNSSSATFKAPAGSTIDWGDGKVQTFDTEDTNVTTHTYSDGKTKHTIVISRLPDIYAEAFSNCSSLISITIGNGVTSIGYRAFFTCLNLTSVTIGNGVTSIGNNAFDFCYELNSVTMGKRVGRIGDWAFSNCRGFKSINIPNSLTRIGIGAFYNCSSLTSVTIGNGVTSIGNNAFVGCGRLEAIVLFPETPPTLGSTSAIPTTISTIYVQQSSKEAYKSETNWIMFANKIISDNIYLSFIIFNQKNKEYISQQIKLLQDYIDSKLTGK